MQNKKLLNTVMALSALALIGGGLIAVQAAENNTFGRKALKENGEGLGFQNLSETDKTKLEAERESHRAEMEANRAASQAAIASGSYTAWKEAVGENSPFAEKVTAENFSKFVEAHKLMDQSREILKSIGIEEGVDMGMGMGKALGHGRGMGQGCGMVK